MSTRGSTRLDDVVPMEWVGESRRCPFDELPARICGCPEGERIMDEAHLIRGED
jgi:hypothetical protein